ncbi:hypothetical protein [Halorubrum kocurii]|uniref:Uncharacterized protein n=1 Tax=Halorubrum kocurii JCM 14978 TaxID=1230456 RepID=M0P7W6_9EURY|nr:hypothetical protein [Halorubrum kocurii]EMA64920.1 hypothetical protein C468_07841 [Halorubrum kocurii JCM 14978]
MIGEDGADRGGEEDERAGDEADPADPLDAAGVDPVVPASAADAAAGEFPDDDEVRAFLREVAADVRGDSSESQQLSAIIYRVSDLYDPDEQTSPEEIYLNVRHIMRIKEQGGIER